MAGTREPIESVCPDSWQYMHPVIRKNFGQWKYHDYPRPSVLRHVAYSGDEIWDGKAGTQSILDLFTLRKLCHMATSISHCARTSNAWSPVRSRSRR